MKDDCGKTITLVHDRFQACCENGCGFISAHKRKSDAIASAQKHNCHRVIVWDAMGPRGRDNTVWSRTANNYFETRERAATDRAPR